MLMIENDFFGKTTPPPHLPQCKDFKYVFHALFAGISCNTFLESLKHADQPWGFVAGFDFVLNLIVAPSTPTPTSSQTHTLPSFLRLSSEMIFNTGPVIFEDYFVLLQ